MRCASLVMGLFLSLVISNLYANNALCQAPHHCLGVVDVGSSGSRLHVYTYELDDNQSPIHIQEQWSNRVTPGFSSLELKQPMIDAYLNDLFSTTIDNDDIPVLFYATAGMRLLPALKQQAYYDAVKQWFSNQRHWTLMEAKTIKGREEGVYGWLAVNYSLDTLKNAASAQIGVMDMGGASVQIVFPVNKETTLPTSRIAQFQLYGKSYTLYSSSTLGLGQNVIAQQFLNHAACFADGYPLADGELAKGNAQVCEQEVTQLVNDVHHVHDELQVALDASSKTWYAMGGISYLAQSPLLHFNDSLTSAALLSQAQEYACAPAWSTIQSIDATLYNHCFNGAYYYALMVNGYGIPEDTLIHMVPKENEWTIGAVLIRGAQ